MNPEGLNRVPCVTIKLSNLATLWFRRREGLLGAVWSNSAESYQNSRFDSVTLVSSSDSNAVQLGKLISESVDTTWLEGEGVESQIKNLWNDGRTRDKVEPSKWTPFHTIIMLRIQKWLTMMTIDNNKTVQLDINKTTANEKSSHQSTKL